MICSKCKQDIAPAYFNRDYHLCPPCGHPIWHAYELRRSAATNLVQAAIKAGELVRPDTCELCYNGDKQIVAHHWNGYDDALSVWWICKSCNHKLGGRRYHIGLIDKEQAKDVVSGKAVHIVLNGDRIK